jgi:ATP-dependent DNA ligase
MASLIAFDLLRLQATIWASVQSESDVALPLLVVGVSGILFSEALAAEGAVAFAKACESGLEGIVSSRALGKTKGTQISSGCDHP